MVRLAENARKSRVYTTEAKDLELGQFSRICAILGRPELNVWFHVRKQSVQKQRCNRKKAFYFLRGTNYTRSGVFHFIINAGIDVSY